MTEKNNLFPEYAQKEYDQYLASFENSGYKNTQKHDRIRGLFLKGQ
jgi:hypothetical protein